MTSKRYMNGRVGRSFLDGLRYLFKEEWLELLITLSNMLKLLCDEIHLLTCYQGHLRLEVSEFFNFVFHRHCLS